MNTRKLNMQVGIIGAGNMGSMLAEYFAWLGCQVSITNSRGPATLAAYAFQKKGITAVTLEEVIREKQIIIIALPVKAVVKLPLHFLSGVEKNVMVIDTCNYFPTVRDPLIPDIENGLTESEWVSQQLGHPVIKAFNCMTALSFATRGLPENTTGRLCMPVAGDDNAHKDRLSEIINAFGFDTIDAGPLSNSWKLQPGAPAYCADTGKETITNLLQQSDYSMIKEYRHKMMQGAAAAIQQFGSLEAAVAQTGRPEKLTYLKTT
ncbi:NADPH-dependent F420 reductase [Ferruginibacter sp.]